MSRQPKKSKRKRHESTRSVVSGISDLSNITWVTDDTDDDIDGRPADKTGSNCTCQKQRTNTEAINVVKPFRNSCFRYCQPAVARERSVSLGLANEDGETHVKEFNNRSNVPCNVNHIGQDQHMPHIDIYAQRCDTPQTVDIPGTHQSRNDITPVNINTCPGVNRSEMELRKKISDQQKEIDRLKKRDKIYTQKLRQRHQMQQNRSVSATSLRDTPVEQHVIPNASEASLCHFYERIPNRSQSNIPTAANINAGDGSVFPFRPRHTANVTQRLSRSCDVLLSEENEDTFIPQPVLNLLPLTSKSSTKHIAEHVSETSSSGSEKGSVKSTLNCSYDFRKWFYILLAVNAVIVALNVSGIPFWYVALKGSEEQLICIKCDNIIMENVGRSAFVKQDDQCCFKSVQHLIELFANVTEQEALPPKAPQAQTKRGVRSEEIALVQYIAEDNPITIGNTTRLAWKSELEYPIQKMFGVLEPHSRNTTIIIPMTGYYFMYGRVKFSKRYGHGKDDVTFGHSVVMLRDKGKEKKLDSVKEICSPTSKPISHTSHLHFVQNFTANDRVYVILDDANYFDSAKYGLFLIQKLSQS